MENQRLLEIKDDLMMLPTLQKRLQKLEYQVGEAEKDIRAVLNKYNIEAADVEQIKRDSFSNTLLKLVKAYDGKLSRETQEMLEAKLEYDKASARIDALYKERDELDSRIQMLINIKHTYEVELKQRETAIKASITNEAYLQYEKLEDEEEILYMQLGEVDEAIRAAKLVRISMDAAMQQLESAEDWATYDVWAKGGIISHMLKYDHIDEAQEHFNTLSFQIKNLNKELSDIKILDDIESIGIASCDRIFDFWFDNIFTDLNIRDKISSDIEKVKSLKTQLDEIQLKLEGSKRATYDKLKDATDRKTEFLINDY